LRQRLAVDPGLIADSQPTFGFGCWQRRASQVAWASKFRLSVFCGQYRPRFDLNHRTALGAMSDRADQLTIHDP